MAKKLLSVLLAAVTLLLMFVFEKPAYAVSASTESLKIVAQPNSVCVSLDDYATVSVEAEGSGLQYQWYYKSENGEQFIKTACTERNYSLKMNSFRHGCQVYCVVTDEFGNQVVSNTVRLAVKVAILKQPESVKVHDGKKAKVVFEAIGDGLTYTWYHKNASAKKFEKVADRDKNNYAVTMATKRDGRQMYCVITDKYGNTATTDVATISMDKSVYIVTQPTITETVEDKTMSVYVEAKGDGLIYEWYYKDQTEDAFQKLDTVSGDTYTAVMDANSLGGSLFCKITDQYGNSVRTDTVTIPKVAAAAFPERLIGKAAAYTVVVFALLFFALKKRDSKKLFNVIMILCWIVIVMSMDSYDISNYRFAYDEGLLRGKEPLFDVLQNAFASAKIPFSTFKLIYSTVIWALLYRAFKNFTADMALAAIIFVIGPMMAFGTQMRNTLAGVLVLNALPILLKKDGEVWKYCMWVAIATLIHAMAALYFIFLIPKYLQCDTKKFRNYLCVIALALIPVCVIAMTLASKVLGNAQDVVDVRTVKSMQERLILYFSGEMSPNSTGFLFSTCAHVVVFFLVDRACAAMLQFRNAGKGETSVLSGYAVDYLCKLNSLMVLIIPCYILSMQFDRFLNYFMPVCYCLIVQGTREVLAFKKTEEGAAYRIMQAGDNKYLRAVENSVWKVVDSKPVQNVLSRLQRFRLGKVLQGGNIELLVLLVWMIFCFFVGNRYSVDSDFVRIVNGIGLFNGPNY